MPPTSQRQINARVGKSLALAVILFVAASSRVASEREAAHEGPSRTRRSMCLLQAREAYERRDWVLASTGCGGRASVLRRTLWLSQRVLIC